LFVNGHCTALLRAVQTDSARWSTVYYRSMRVAPSRFAARHEPRVRNRQVACGFNVRGGILETLDRADERGRHRGFDFSSTDDGTS
jgi:hypothetical protein